MNKLGAPAYTMVERDVSHKSTLESVMGFWFWISDLEGGSEKDRALWNRPCQKAGEILRLGKEVADTNLVRTVFIFLWVIQ